MNLVQKSEVGSPPPIRNPLDYIAALIGGLETFFYRLAQIILVVMMFFSASDTLMRYLFSKPFPGGYEIIAEYLLPYLVFLSLAYIFRQGGHVRVTLLTMLLPARAQRYILMFNNCIAVLLFCVLTYAAYLKTMKAYTIGEYSSNVLSYPLWPAFAVVMVGFALMVLRILITIIRREDPYANGEELE